MKKDICPRSGLAQSWAPRARTIFCIVLCILILSLSVPIGAFASSNVQMYDYNGHVFPALPTMGSSDNALIFQYISSGSTEIDTHLVIYINSVDGVTYMPYINSSGALKVYGKPAVFYKLDSDSWVFVKRYATATGINYPNFIYSNYSDFISSNQDNSGFFIWCSENISNDYTNSVIIGSSPVPIQTQSTEYFITTEGNVNDLYTGESLQFYCQTNEGIQAESLTWSIQNASDYTGLSISDTGLFIVSADSHSIGTVTVQASDINGTYTFTTFDLTIFAGENPDSGGGEGGDTPTPTPTPDASNQDVIDSIDDGFSNLENKLEDTGNNIIDGLLEGLKSFFIPSAEELSAKIDDFKAWIEEKLPLLNIPISVVSYIYDMFFGVNPDAALIDFPEVSWMGEVLIEETSLDLTQYSWLNDVLPIIRTLLTAGCALAFINWIMKKIQGVASA